MVLAAGLGKRLRPITNTMPKPLVPIAGKTLLDRGLDALAAAGVEKAVVNVHHFPDQVRRHVAPRTVPRVVISDESDALARIGGRHRQGAAGAWQRSVLSPQRRHLLDRSRGLRSRAAGACLGRVADGYSHDARRSRPCDRSLQRHRLRHRRGRPARARKQRAGRVDLCRSGDRRAAHLRRRGGCAAIVRFLFRPRHRRRPALRHEDGWPLDHGRARPTPYRSPNGHVAAAARQGT